MKKSTLIKFKREMIEMLLVQGTDINAKGCNTEIAPDITTPFWMNAIAEALSAHNAINARGHNGTTLLHVAAHAGKKYVLKLLLAQGADVEAKDNNGNTALNWVVPYAYKEIVKLLLMHGADVNAKNNFGISPLDNAISFGNEEIAEVLLAAGAKHGDAQIKYSKVFSLVPGLPVKPYLVGQYGRKHAPDLCESQ